VRRESGERQFTLEGHTDSVVDVAFNASGTLLASAGMDGVVKVWTSLLLLYYSRA